MCAQIASAVACAQDFAQSCAAVRVGAWARLTTFGSHYNVYILRGDLHSASWQPPENQLIKFAQYWLKRIGQDARPIWRCTIWLGRNSLEALRVIRARL